MRDGDTVERRSYRFGQMPRVDDAHRVHWECNRLGVSGHWQSLSAPIEHKLYERNGATVMWRCVAPRARAFVDTGTGEAIEGFGYVERLDLKVYPWRLPIDVLRWGRFLSPKHDCVWIDWEGSDPLRLLVHNGRVHREWVLEPSVIYVPGARLQLSLHDDRLVVRRPAIRPRWLLRTLASLGGGPRTFDLLEERWVSRGTIDAPADEAESGWVLHEKVTWR